MQALIRVVWALTSRTAVLADRALVQCGPESIVMRRKLATLDDVVHWICQIWPEFANLATIGYHLPLQIDPETAKFGLYWKKA